MRSLLVNECGIDPARFISILHFDGARYRVGPDSAGANPGPASYRKNGPLAVTDCNVMLGKVQPKFFPVPAAAASKWILAALEQGTDAALRLSGAIMRAVWVEERNVADAQTLSAIAHEQGFDAVTLAERAGSGEVSARYDELTQEAIDRKVFGSPWYVYQDEPFWGQDRLDFLDRSLAK